MKKSEVKKTPSGVQSSDSKKWEKPGKIVSGPSAVSYVKSGSSGKSADLKEVECFKCHKKGHYANKCPEAKDKDSKGVFKVRKLGSSESAESDATIRHVRIRYSDLGSEGSDGFLRYWFLILDLGDPVQSSTNEGQLAKAFVDTGASCNTIDRSSYKKLMDQGLRSEYIEGPDGGMEVALVGGRSLHVKGDKIRMQMDVRTNMGRRGSVGVLDLG
jgi:hypothetical protein